MLFGSSSRVDLPCVQRRSFISLALLLTTKNVFFPRPLPTILGQGESLKVRAMFRGFTTAVCFQDCITEQELIEKFSCGISFFAVAARCNPGSGAGTSFVGRRGYRWGLHPFALNRSTCVQLLRCR